MNNELNIKKKRRGNGTGEEKKKRLSHTSGWAAASVIIQSFTSRSQRSSASFNVTILWGGKEREEKKGRKRGREMIKYYSSHALFVYHAISFNLQKKRDRGKKEEEQKESKCKI